MEPIPETIEAIDELDAFVDDGSLLEVLRSTAARAQAIAADLAGVSVAALEQGLTFTLVATDDEIAALDGVQYLTNGPCVEVADVGRGLATTSDDLLSERRWHAFGTASAAAGVRSTITFPIMDGGRVTGTVNLYGLSDETFDGKHEALAAVFRAWAPGAVKNADLSFATRRWAQQAPRQLRDEAVVDAATGIVSAIHDVTLDEARAQLADAARRAGVSLAVLAQSLIHLHSDMG